MRSRFMRIAQDLAGYSLGEANLSAPAAMGKKKVAEMRNTPSVRGGCHLPTV